MPSFKVCKERGGFHLMCNPTLNITSNSTKTLAVALNQHLCLVVNNREAKIRRAQDEDSLSL